MKGETVYSEVRVDSFENVQMSGNELGFWKKLIVAHAYPPKLILDSIGLMWSLHFVWERMWVQAVGAAVVFSSIGTFLARKVDKEALASTRPGRFFLELFSPGNALIQLVGYATIVFGVWARSTFYVLIGISIVLFVYAAVSRRVFLNSFSKEV